VARDLGVELVVPLGALLADVPHTRPAPVTGSASDPKLVEELGLASSRYEGPTGIVGVVHDACRRAGGGPGRGRAPRGDPKLVGDLGLPSSGSGGPTGIVGVVHDACGRAEVPSASL